MIITRLGSTVTLQCTIEASPKAVHFWVKKGTEPGHEGDYLQWLKSKQIYSKLWKIPVFVNFNDKNLSVQASAEIVKKKFYYGKLISNIWFSEISINNPNGRYKLTEEHESLYSYRIALTITNVAMTDLGNYTCGARNSYGTVQGTISLKSKKI